MIEPTESGDRAWLRQLLDALPTPVVVYAASGEVLLANRARTQLMGERSTLDDAVRRAVPRHDDGTAFRREELPAVRALAGETVRGLRLRLRVADGTDVVMLAHASPLRDASGAVVSAVLVFSDITALSQLESGRRELFSMASHDLRTPLTAIQGYVQLARRVLSRDSARADAMLERVERECARMLRLTRDLLDSARFETGAIPVRLEPDDLAARVRAAVARQAEAAPVTAALPDEPVLLLLDADRVDQVLDNLLANAVRHNGPGTAVEVTLAREADEVVVRVRDHGAGIADDERARLFQPFAHVPRARNFGGTGLGLHISRRIAEAHGGRLWLEDTGPAGTTFAFALPART